jgi:hypothetical protein
MKGRKFAKEKVYTVTASARIRSIRTIRYSIGTPTLYCMHSAL